MLKYYIYNMTTTRLRVEKKRIDKLNLILFWIEEAKIKIGRQEFNLNNSHIAGEGVKYYNRINILKQAINRLDTRYFMVLNGFNKRSTKER